MNTESQRQELASRLVQREVGNCVSSLMSGIMEVALHLTYRQMQDAFGTDQDELMELFQRPDYETAAYDFIDDADEADLETIAELNGDWADVLASANVPDVEELEPDEDGGERWAHVGVTPQIIFDCESDAREVAVSESLPAIRKAVKAMAIDCEEVCQEFNLDPDYIEVYEHWIVSNWLAAKLKARGEVTRDFAGLTIWGRCCTGQSMAMDSVIQDIAVEHI